ncbi:MAG: YihA family ribosome biogenesis GTP-binding protein [Oscillospiraceae bacterium]|nr:YihA family ribosome biogenesis GTP-binding protein [Oscillospiraceae bacterium]
MALNLNRIEFIRSAASPEQFIADGRPCAVFAGKSNVGKSSVINRLMNRKSLARVSAVPGKTVHVNYFLVDGSLYLVDLPGYGYARVDRAEKERWGRLMEAFFARPELMTFGVMLVDARHRPTADDVTMAEWFKSSGKPFLEAANKADKLKKSEIEGNLAVIRETLSLPEDIGLVLFSAETGLGRQEVLSAITSL